MHINFKLLSSDWQQLYLEIRLRAFLEKMGSIFTLSRRHLGDFQFWPQNSFGRFLHLAERRNWLSATITSEQRRQFVQFGCIARCIIQLARIKKNPIADDDLGIERVPSAMEDKRIRSNDSAFENTQTIRHNSGCARKPPMTLQQDQCLGQHIPAFAWEKVSPPLA
jgi:hypothetical protein